MGLGPIFKRQHKPTLDDAATDAATDTATDADAQCAYTLRYYETSFELRYMTIIPPNGNDATSF